MAENNLSKKVIMQENGKIFIPKRFRSLLGIEPHDHVLFYVEDGLIKIKKLGNVCRICGKKEESLLEFGEHFLCTACMSHILITNR